MPAVSPAPRRHRRPRLTFPLILPGLSLLAVACVSHETWTGPPNLVYIASGGSRSIAVLDGDTLERVATVDVHEARPVELAFTPDGRRLFAATSEGGSILAISPITHRVTKTIPAGGPVHALAVAPDGRELWFLAGDGGEIGVVEVATFTVQARIPLPERMGAGGIAFRPDGRKAYAAGPASGAVAIVDVPGRRLLGTIPVRVGTKFLAVNSDGSRIWAANPAGGDLYLIDGDADRIVGVMQVGGSPRRLAFVGRDLYVTLGAGGEVVVVADVGGHLGVSHRIPVGTSPNGIWMSVDGARVFVASEGSGDLHAIDTATKRVIGTVPVGKDPTAVIVSR